jgi:hypothetical protein
VQNKNMLVITTITQLSAKQPVQGLAKINSGVNVSPIRQNNLILGPLSQSGDDFQVYQGI